MNALSYISSNLVVPLEKLNKSNEKLQDDDRDDGTTKPIKTPTTENNESRIWMVLLFLPRYLFLRPIQFIWWLICSPLLLIEYGIKSRNKSRHRRKENVMEIGSNLKVISENDEDDLAGGDEIFLQRDAIKGSLAKASSSGRRQSVNSRSKSTVRSDCSSNVVFGTKRMGRFLFPKKLIPKSVLHAERRKRLVVDLDETLIHSASRSTSHSNSSQGHMVEVRFAISGVSTLYYVHKRPHCDLFLSKVSKWYDLVVFTASMKEYADPVIDWLESSFSGRFSKRLYRNNCILRDGVGYIKDLSIVCGPMANSSNVGLGEVILVDNSPVSYAMNVDNAIQVEGWISDPSDTDLLTLLPFLEAIRYTTDVRDILALKNGEQAFLQ